MKKLLSILLAVSMVLTPINSRVSFADETASNETDYEQGYELNETSDGEVSDLSKINEPSLCKRLWQGVKSGTIKATEIVGFIYAAAAADPQFTIVTTLWATTIFAVIRFANQFNNNAKNGVAAMMSTFSESLTNGVTGISTALNNKLTVAIEGFNVRAAMQAAVDTKISKTITDDYIRNTVTNIARDVVSKANVAEIVKSVAEEFVKPNDGK